jgi:hypothetical protein
MRRLDGWCTATAARRRPWRRRSSGSFLAHKLAEKNEKRGRSGGGAREERGARVSPGATSVGFKEEGEGSRAWRARCWKGSR